MKSKISIPDYILIIVIASATLPVLVRNLPSGALSFAYVWAPITLLITLFLRPTTYTKGPIVLVLLYAVIMVGVLQYTLWSFMSDWNRPRILLEAHYFLATNVILYYYIGVRDYRGLARLSKWAFVFIVISLITTQIALFLDPNVIRASANSEAFTSFQQEIYNRAGVIGYHYAQAIIGLIPVLIYHIKSKRNMVLAPNALIVVLFLILIVEIRSQVFANLLITVLITVLSIIGLERRRVLFFTAFLFFLLYVIVPSSFYSDIIQSIGSAFDSQSETYFKFNDLASFIQNPEIDSETAAGSRVGRYPMLLDALFSSPLLGDASYNSNLDISVGYHLFFMNRLAIWGVLGFAFYAFVLYRIFKSVMSLFNKGFRFYYALSVLSLLLFGASKMVAAWDHWLMLIVIIPGLYYWPYFNPQKTSLHK